MSLPVLLYTQTRASLVLECCDESDFWRWSCCVCQWSPPGTEFLLTRRSFCLQSIVMLCPRSWGREWGQKRGSDKEAGREQQQRQSPSSHAWERKTPPEGCQQCQTAQTTSQNYIKLWMWPTGRSHSADPFTLLRGGKKMSQMCSKADS